MQKLVGMLDNQTKEILSRMFENGSVIMQLPLVGLTFDYMREKGLLIEEVIGTGCRCSLSKECKEYFSKHQHMLEVDYSHLKGSTAPDFDLL